MWRMAWRNLWRNRTRTIIVTTAIALTYAMFLLSLGIAAEIHGELEKAAIKMAGGNILVHGDGFWDAQTNEYLVDDPGGVIAAAERIDGVEAAVPRVLIAGLIRSTTSSAGVRLTGIQPDGEALLMDMRPYLIEGSFLDGDEADPLVLGIGLVEELEAELGDRLVLTATDPEGEVGSALFHLSGIVDTGSPTYNDTVALTTIGAAQAALGMGERVTQIGLLIERDKARFEVRDALAAELSGGATIELLTWDEAMPEMRGYIEIDDNFNYIFSFVMFIVVAFGITNSFMMVVMERIRELGLLGALGLTPRRIGRMLVNETALLALFSMLVGLTLGFGFHYWFATHGLDMSEVYGELEVSGVSLTDTVIRSKIIVHQWIWASVGVFVMVVVASLYPAWRATRVDPAQAMRTYE